MSYVGRFAPSPTGLLHIGSLTTAVASYLHARQNAGEWLVRIEDIDPPREAPGATDAILRTLEALGLHWDRSVLYQSERHEAYLSAAQTLLDSGRAFRCTCSRKQVQEQSGTNGRYPGTCRRRGIESPDSAIRVRVDDRNVEFDDRLQGPISRRLDTTEGDYLIFRRDGLPAYHLAVVVDDAFQGVTDIVRGVDLLDSTTVHIHLQRQLRLPTPRYWHLPVVANATGQKLSKQTGAEGITPEAAPRHAAVALHLLGMELPRELAGASLGELWSWAASAWRPDQLKLRTVIDLDQPARSACSTKGLD